MSNRDTRPHQAQQITLKLHCIDAQLNEFRAILAKSPCANFAAWEAILTYRTGALWSQNLLLRPLTREFDGYNA